MNIKTWKTIEIGKYKTIKALKEAVSKKATISSWANDILDKVKLSEKQNIDLVRMTVSEMGFPNGATLKEIYAKAKELGLDLCPPEVGAYLILKPELDYGWTTIGMEPIKDSDGGPDLLSSYRDGGGRWLYASYGRPGDLWNVDGGFAFAVPQVSTKPSETQTSLDAKSSDLMPLTLNINGVEYIKNERGAKK